MHCGFDGWREVREIASTPAPFDRHVVPLPRSLLAGHRTFDFTLYFPGSDRWEGEDHRIALPPP